MERGETLIEAAHRKARQELGIPITTPHPIGYFEAHFNRHRAAGNKHTVSIVMAASPRSSAVHLDDQSSDWRWSEELPRAFTINLFNAE